MIKNLKLVSVLRQLGLNQREAQIYLASLEKGDFASAGELAKLASVNRGTAYHIVNELEKKNFLKSSMINEIKTYISQPVKNIMKILVDQEKEIHAKKILLKNTVDDFQNIVKTNDQLNEIEFFYGEEAVQSFYKSLPWGDYHYCIFSAESYDKVFARDTYYGTGSIETLKNMQGYVLISQTDHPSHDECINFMEKEIPGLDYKIFDQGCLQTDTMIFPGKFVAIINLDKNNLHGVKIKCKTLIESYARMFEEVWEKSPGDIVIKRKI